MIDRIIDRFAEKLASRGCYIEPADNQARITAFAQHLPEPLPRSFYSLLSRYNSLDFEIEPLWFFANTGEESEEEWQFSILKDEFLSGFLLANGYIQFARPDTGSYDPICFDTKRKQGNGESPIVWIDHEGVLIHEKIVVREEVAPSFLGFVQNYLA